MKYRRKATHYGIDAGELASLSREKCFMLGVEFELFKRRIDDHRATGCGITTTVHSVNVERLAAVLDDMGITYQRKWLNDDWVDLTVKPTDDCEAMRPKVGHVPEDHLRNLVFAGVVAVWCVAAAVVAVLIFGR